MERIKLLVVDDEFLIQELLVDQFHEGGFETITVSTAKEAMELLEKGQFRALITDINLLSDLTGWDVARHARRLSSDLPVIYMTGDSAAAWTS